MTDRETLIEEAAKAIVDAWAWVEYLDVQETLADDAARAALSVFEKALGEATVTPTDDEREALADLIAEERDKWPRVANDMGSEDAEVTLTTEAVEANREYIERTAELQGEPSDAQVQAAWEALNEIHDTGSEAMRAALRAAGGVR